MISVIIFLLLFCNILKVKAPIFIVLVLFGLFISVLNEDWPGEKKVKKK